MEMPEDGDEQNRDAHQDVDVGGEDGLRCDAVIQEKWGQEEPSAKQASQSGGDGKAERLREPDQAE